MVSRACYGSARAALRVPGVSRRPAQNDRHGDDPGSDAASSVSSTAGSRGLAPRPLLPGRLDLRGSPGTQAEHVGEQHLAGADDQLGFPVTERHPRQFTGGVLWLPVTVMTDTVEQRTVPGEQTGNAGHLLLRELIEREPLSEPRRPAHLEIGLCDQGLELAEALGQGLMAVAGAECVPRWPELLPGLCPRRV